MADIQIKAAYGSVVEEDEDALLFIAFAEGEDDDGSYVVLQQPLEGGPVRLEVNDENFAAEVVELMLCLAQLLKKSYSEF